MALDETFYGAPDAAPSFQALDAGSSNIDWNGLLKGVADTAGAIARAKAKAPQAPADTTPVPATSPVQVPQTVGGMPTMMVLAGIAVVAVLFLALRK